jgi:hypothetical protein
MINSQQALNHFLQASKVTHSTDANAVYRKLPTAIRDEILFHLNSETLDHIPLFRHITNLSVKLHLFSHMTVKVGAAGRRLIKSGKSGSDIFFLVVGDAAIYQVLDGCSKQQQRPSTSPPVTRESTAAGFVSRLGASLLHLRRKRAKDKVGVVKSCEELQSKSPDRPARTKRVEKIPTRRSMAQHMSSKERVRARFNW